jgi:hypothetical protein
VGTNSRQHKFPTAAMLADAHHRIGHKKETTHVTNNVAFLLLRSQPPSSAIGLNSHASAQTRKSSDKRLCSVCFLQREARPRCMLRCCLQKCWKLRGKIGRRRVEKCTCASVLKVASLLQGLPSSATGCRPVSPTWPMTVYSGVEARAAIMGSTSYSGALRFCQSDKGTSELQSPHRRCRGRVSCSTHDVRKAGLPGPVLGSLLGTLGIQGIRVRSNGNSRKGWWARLDSRFSRRLFSQRNARIWEPKLGTVATRGPGTELPPVMPVCR